MPHSIVTRFEQESDLVVRRSRTRRIHAAIRDTWVLMREFQGALIFFAIVLAVGALSFRLLWNRTFPADPITFVESLYDMLTMIVFEPTVDFPEQWYLEVYLFLMPLLGVIALARGLTDFMALLFNRHQRQRQWEEAVASTLNNHIIVCGLGHVGIRVVQELILLDEDIVVIEAKPDSPRFAQLDRYNIPYIIGDGRIIEILEKAGIDRASAFIICTNDDLMNLQIASRVREINKTIRLVMRMFDDQFGRSMTSGLDLQAVMSASALAAPAFAGAATANEIMQTFNVQDKKLVLGRIEIKEGSRLDGAETHGVEEELDISIVLYQSGNMVDLHPNPGTILKAGDVIAVVTSLVQFKKLAARWNR